MTKYAVSPEGAEALKKLATEIRNLMEHVSLVGNTLKNEAVSLDDRLGSFSDRVISLANDCVSTVTSASLSVDDLACLLESKAGIIEALLGETMTHGVSSSDISSTLEQTNTMRPERGASPRCLISTQYGWNEDGDGVVYNHPIDMGEYLYASQGSAYPAKFAGTCGLCSCANILRLAGVDFGEKEMIDYAAPSKLCHYVMSEPDASGGTSPWERQAVLEHFGISSEIVPIQMENGAITKDSMNKLASYVEKGHGVIVSVHANVLYASGPAEDDFHAVTVTSVKRSVTGELTGFFIADSNTGTAYYPVSLVQSALTGNAMNVTRNVIR